jgi:hypothetical protein
MLTKILSKYEDIALSNFDILQKINNKANIVLYPNLHKYKTIDEILGPYEACILLFEAKPKYGHWVCIFKRNNKTIEFFNPYGGYPDDSLLFINDEFRKKSNQEYPILSLLLLNSPYDLTYNEFKFQKKNQNIKTCGRHCIVRLLFRNLDLYKYHDMLEYLKKELNMSYDEIVTLLTL